MEGLPKISLPSEIQCAPHCKCWRHEEEPKLDRRLVAWTRNQRYSERMQNYLCETIGRPRHQLLMNSLEKYRAVQEQRTLTTYAQVTCKFDKYRGNPTWWETPPMLRKKCAEPQEYFVQLSRLERLIVPQLEYVQVSKLFSSGDHLQHTKNIRSASENDYAKKRLDSVCLKKIQPHIPDMEDVYVIGEAARRPEVRLESLASLCESFWASAETERGTEQETEKKHSFTQENQSPTFLIINDRRITADAHGIVKTSVIFEATCGNETETHYLFVQNQSSWSLRIFFQETTSKPTFTTAAAAAGNEETRFFFDRNYRIIMPGEKVNVPFWFQSVKCGFFAQLLHMTVVPDLWEGKVTIQIALNASTKQENHLENCRQYEDMIQDRVRTRLINESLKVMLRAIPPKESAIKVYTFDKGTIFEALNSTFDPIHARPQYLYDKDIVDELEAFYDAVRLEAHPELWNLSINDLRTVTKDREVFERVQKLSANYDHIFNEIETNKRVRSEMRLRLDEMFMGEKGGKRQKTQKEVKNAGKDKKEKRKASTSPVKDKIKGKNAPKIIKEPERDDLPKTLSDELEAIISKLQTPTLSENIHCELFKVVYNLFCSYMDKITEEVNEMCRNYFSLERPDPLKVLTNAFNLTQLKCDQLASCDMDAKAFFDYPKIPGTEQPAWTLEIPMCDYEARFEAMHAITDKTKATKGAKGTTASKSGKKLKASKKDATKSSTKTKSTKKTAKSKKTNLTLTNVELLEIAEEEITEEEQHEDEEGVFEQLQQDWYYLIPGDKIDHYRNNMYVVFYKNLCDFAEDFEAVYLLMSGEEPRPAEIQRIKFSQQQDLLRDEGLQVQCVNLNQRISQLLRTGEYSEAEEIYPSPKYPTLGQKQPQQDLLEKSSSIWNVIKAYVPRRLRMKPEKEDVPEVQEEETVNIPDELATEKQIQTSLCSDITVDFSGDVFPLEEKRRICVCGRGIDSRRAAKMVSSFHNSECMKSSTPTETTPDISSLDT